MDGVGLDDGALRLFAIASLTMTLAVVIVIASVVVRLGRLESRLRALEHDAALSRIRPGPGRHRFRE